MIALDIISEAIGKKKKIQFIYNEYGTDFKLHPRRDKEYIVSSYQLSMTNGKYYLIGNYDKYDDISHYRVDRITCVKILPEPIKPKNRIKEFAQIGFNLPKHMAEHIYMYSGESIWIKFLADVDLMDEFVDWFGKDFRVKKLDNNKIRVTLKCNEQAMIYWALQYGNDIVMESPKSLIDSVKKLRKKLWQIINSFKRSVDKWSSSACLKILLKKIVYWKFSLKESFMLYIVFMKIMSL